MLAECAAKVGSPLTRALLDLLGVALIQERKRFLFCKKETKNFYLSEGY
jgi:hypothetical protein